MKYISAMGVTCLGTVAGLVVVTVLAAGAQSAVVSWSGRAWNEVPSPQALSDIPAGYLQTFEAAAATCPGLPWSVLAGIGRAESDFGADTQTSSAGAVGPMQFLPGTFAAYATPVPPGGVNPPSPLDPTDAIYAAARDLCANGAKDGADISGAIYAYNRSQAYVAEVLSYAAAYAGAQPPALPQSPAAAKAVSFALAQIGTPYRWGDEIPGSGFDCSGLTQAAWDAAGITIPRTSEAQWLALPHVPLDQLQPGDLVFFYPGEFVAALPGHVGIYIGSDLMVDAPHPGATVRVEDLASWPSPFGVARPG